METKTAKSIDKRINIAIKYYKTGYFEKYYQIFLTILEIVRDRPKYFLDYALYIVNMKNPDKLKVKIINCLFLKMKEDFLSLIRMRGAKPYLNIEKILREKNNACIRDQDVQFLFSGYKKKRHL